MAKSPFEKTKVGFLFLLTKFFVRKMRWDNEKSADKWLRTNKVTNMLSATLYPNHITELFFDMTEKRNYLCNRFNHNS